MRRIKVAVNGYGTIGKRVAEAIMLQPDMELVGIAKTKPDYAALLAYRTSIPIYTSREHVKLFENNGIRVAGTIEDMLREADVVVDATPAGTGAKYKPLYEKYGVKALFQGGEKPIIADASFNSYCNYDECLDKKYIRVVSCNTTGLLRLLCSLNIYNKIRRVRATIVRRAADPKEDKKGPINSIKPNPATVPSHHGIDVKSVLRNLNIITTAVIVPTTLMHLHIVNIEFENPTTREDVIYALSARRRIALVNAELSGIDSTAKIIEAARDLGRKRYDVPELIVWEDSIHVSGNEVVLMQAVHQESIVVPENIDAVRAVTGIVRDPEESIRITDKTLKIGVFHEMFSVPK